MCTAEGPCPHRGFPSNADPDFENIFTQIYIYIYKRDHNYNYLNQQSFSSLNRSVF